MFGIDLVFDRPWYLLLLLLAPLLWFASFRSLAGLGRWRRIAALALRTAVLLLIVFALAEMQRVLTSQKLTVLYVLDQSESIPAVQRQAMLDYVGAEVRKHRNAERGDKAGVIVFGREAIIESAPFDDDLPLAGRVETQVSLRSDATNLAAALKLAQAAFPEDSARRVVVVTDGNENLGDARAVARQLFDAGVGVDVVPVVLAAKAEVAVEKVALPVDIRKDEPFEVRVVVSNFGAAGAAAAKVRGTLKLERKNGDQVEPLGEQEVELRPGKNVYSFKQQVKFSDFYTYEARFVPATAGDDTLTENNRATAFTHVQGEGHILFIVDSESPPAEHDDVITMLRTRYEVTKQDTSQLFNSLAELQRYDAVVLANVPRSNERDIEKVNSEGAERATFSDDRVNMLVRNTQQLGSGLVMLGGDKSFGLGGWAGSELEKAMPVDFTIKNHKVAPVGALVMVMHASEMPQGNYWQKLVGVEALKSLGLQDYCGVVQDVGGSSAWLWNDAGGGVVRVGSEAGRQKMLGRLDKMVPGDMPDFNPSMQMAAQAFAALGSRVSMRHMIIISDGDPAPPTPPSIQALKNANATVTTVAIGTHGPPAATPLADIAKQLSGKFYNVTNPKALPRIYQREARRVARPLVWENETVQPQVKFPHEILQGVADNLPPIRGFVLTTVKENPLVEVALVSPKPADDDYANATLLAAWTYGLGRTAVLTTDCGQRWASAWRTWPAHEKLMLQLVRWSMRPVNRGGKFTLATDVIDGKVKVAITALDNNDDFLNFLNMTGSVIGPNMQPFEIGLKQVAPGRYTAEFEATQQGSYFLNVVPGAGKAPLRTGVNVPYSAEYRERESNLALMTDLVSQPPKGGEAGLLIEGPLAKGQLDALLGFDTFRHNLAKATSSQNIWPYLLLIGACLFFADVFVRRVSLGWEWLAPITALVREHILRRGKPAPADDRLARLRSRKEEVTQNLEERRAAARFEPQLEVPSDVGALQAGAASPAPSAPAAEPSKKNTLAPAKPDEESYTARLLRAKEQARKKKPEG